MQTQIYALSDVHGYLAAFNAAMAQVPLTQTETELLIMGDLIDGGPDSGAVVQKVYDLVREYPHRVHFLLGNHEAMFLDFLFGNNDTDWLSADVDLNTVKSFLSEQQLQELMQTIREDPAQLRDLVRNKLLATQGPLFKWLRTQQHNLFIETDTQIFVHAGVDEDAGNLWRIGTSDETFYGQYPPQTGTFLKTVIAGHVGSAEVAHNRKYLGHVYWDHASHIFIDGTVSESGVIPVLHYDGLTGSYTEVGSQELIK